MKKAMFVVALLAIPAIAYAGTATMSLKNNADGLSTVTVGQAGGTVTISLNLDTYANAPGGIATVVATATASEAGLSITGRATGVVGGPFKASDSWGVPPTGALNLVSKELGVSATSFTGHGDQGANYVAPTDGELPWKIETITVSVPAGLDPKTWTLNITAGSYVDTTEFDGGGDQYPLDTTLIGMTIVRTPEPATMLLLAAALPFLRRRSA